MCVCITTVNKNSDSKFEMGFSRIINIFRIIIKVKLIPCRALYVFNYDVCINVCVIKVSIYVMKNYFIIIILHKQHPRFSYCQLDQLSLLIPHDNRQKLYYYIPYMVIVYYCAYNELPLATALASTTADCIIGYNYALWN